MVLVYPPPRMPVTNEGLGWDSRAKNSNVILVVVVFDSILGVGTGVVPSFGTWMSKEISKKY